MNWTAIIDRLRNEAGIEFSPGLTAAECTAAEYAYGFIFPADLKKFLMTALPKGKKFSDWRDTDSEKIQDWFALPLDGLLFDVEQNNI